MHASTPGIPERPNTSHPSCTQNLRQVAAKAIDIRGDLRLRLPSATSRQSHFARLEYTSWDGLSFNITLRPCQTIQHIESTCWIAACSAGQGSIVSFNIKCYTTLCSPCTTEQNSAFDPICWIVRQARAIKPKCNNTVDMSYVRASQSFRDRWLRKRRRTRSGLTFM